MPHSRVRHLSPLLIKSFRYSAITGVIGHRQVGKTTLSATLGGSYVTLDTAQEQAMASVAPEGFLAKITAGDTGELPVVIDECQLAPPLFPALKEWVRLRKRPGQFLLTGSVRFTSRKAIRESLTGRIITWELLPMDWSEQHSQPLPDHLLRLLKSKSIGTPQLKSSNFSDKHYEKYLETGGLPGVFSVRESSIRTQRFETQINTILERDLKLLIETTLPFKSLRKLLAALARQTGGPLSLADLNRETRLTAPTLRKLIAAFEALFLIRFIESEGDYLKPTLFFEDLGERNHLLSEEIGKKKQLVSFLYQNLRVQWHYRPEEKIRAYAYRTRRGCNVPLCIAQNKEILGIVPLLDTDDLPDAQRNAELFLMGHPQAKVLIVSVMDQDQVLTPRVRWLGVGRLLG